MEVRDAIHGPMRFDDAEQAVIDQEFVQRLRNIAQIGFSNMPFPGATHTRYSHSLGAAHLAGMAFDSAYRDWTFSDADARQRFRACVRLAALCHDLGHPPFSHSTEFSLPALSKLGIGWYRHPEERQATHEDLTIAILEQSSLAKIVAERFPFTSRHVGALINHEIRPGDDFFKDGGFDHRRLLSQIVSSELDVDRLDYLIRDAHYTGTQYGKVEADWLVSSLQALTKDGQVGLAIDSSAIYAFEDFLISRYHMFLMVYFHHKTVIYEETLRRYVETEADWSVPVSMADYRWFDDVAMTQRLRSSANPWARRVVEQRTYKRLVERHGTTAEVDLTKEEAKLRAAGVDCIAASCVGRLSRYAQLGQSGTGLYVVDAHGGGMRPLVEVSRVFQRYADARFIGRLYVDAPDVVRAREVLGIKG